jgi:hypothetical protein
MQLKVLVSISKPVAVKINDKSKNRKKLEDFKSSKSYLIVLCHPNLIYKSIF